MMGKSSTPVCTVIIPAYNCEATIEQTLRSALNQTVRGLRVLLVDDGSADRTVERAIAAAEGDERLEILRNERNLGVAGARNRGIDQAKSPFLAFLDADDVWVRDKLARQLAQLDRTGADLCYTAYALMDNGGNPLGQTYHVPPSAGYRDLLKENVIGLSTVLLRADSLGSLRMDEKYFHEDYEFWLNLLKRGRRAVGLDSPLVFYRLGGRSENKLLAAKNRWLVYRRSQRLGFFPSCKYMACYAYHGLRKLGG
ncbi:MAG: glycosyltransferase family 2 protein [Provencibacterium sp.]|nr:glycosyltransferase family 2 protein [Provencibacterium sp.]